MRLVLVYYVILPFLIDPHMFPHPRDNGSTSRRSISSLELPDRISACIAAPAAKATVSGLNDQVF